LESFLESSRKKLLKFHLASLVDLMDEYTRSKIAPDRLIIEMRAQWTMDQYHKKKNEQEKLVSRQDGEVWFAWVRQFLWCVFFTWVGAFFGFERHLARKKTGGEKKNIWLYRKPK